MSTYSYKRTSTLTRIGAIAIACAMPTHAFAQAAGPTYPVKPLRIVLGFSAGGSSDILARLLAQKVSASIGQSVIVENRPGAGGNLAGELVSKSAPDGYTLLLANQGILATNVSLYSKLGFDPVTDFAPIILLASQPTVLVVHPSLPAKSVKELIALAQRNPGELNYSSSGVGAATHLAGELFKSMAKVNIVHVPYKGAQRALTDLISGEVQLMFASVTSAKAHMDSKRLRGLAVTDAKRLATLPQLPTMAEAGLPGYEARAWHGVVAPAGTPAAVITRLNSEFGKAIQLPDVRAKLASQGAEVLGSTPQQFAAYIKAEIPKWARIIKESGARAD